MIGNEKKIIRKKYIKYETEINNYEQKWNQ